jgi:hypothetical protein
LWSPINATAGVFEAYIGTKN